MSDDDARQQRVRMAVTTSAACLGAAGLVLTFAPAESGARLTLPSTPLALQLLGAALLGFAVMNWTARGSTLGGIYGRAVVAGNQMHFTVGGLALLMHGIEAGGSPAFWALTLAYLLGAALFLHLMFRGGPRGQGVRPADRSCVTRCPRLAPAMVKMSPHVRPVARVTQPEEFRCGCACLCC